MNQIHTRCLIFVAALLSLAIGCGDDDAVDPKPTVDGSVVDSRMIDSSTSPDSSSPDSTVGSSCTGGVIQCDAVIPQGNASVCESVGCTAAAGCYSKFSRDCSTINSQNTCDTFQECTWADSECIGLAPNCAAESEMTGCLQQNAGGTDWCIWAINACSGSTTTSCEDVDKSRSCGNFGCS